MTLTPPREASSTDALAARLQDPAVAESVSRILDHADLVALVLDSLSQFIARSEVIGDSVIDGVDELRETAQDSGLDIEATAAAALALAKVLPQAAPGMVDVADSGVIDKVLASDLVSPAAVEEVSVLARGLVTGAERYPGEALEVSGPVSVLRLLRDPDIKRALSYAATVTKAVGQQLARRDTTGRPGRAG